MFFRYLRYLILHKWYVFVECAKRGITWQGLVHDLSKFRPDEFGPYMRYFYGSYLTQQQKDLYLKNTPDWARKWKSRETVNKEFDVAWLKHQHRNPHHWQHWLLREDDGGFKILDMPHQYCVEMLCDWIGAGKALGKPDTLAWYSKNRDNIYLSPIAQEWIEDQLGYN